MDRDLGCPVFFFWVAQLTLFITDAALLKAGNLTRARQCQPQAQQGAGRAGRGPTPRGEQMRHRRRQEHHTPWVAHCILPAPNPC